MQKLIISLICCLLPALTFADTLAIRDNAPDRYVVVKGDTLWDISSKFFEDPWKWPQIWGLNKDSIKNPHWIYPGDVVLLDRNAATLKVVSGIAPITAASGVSASGVSASGVAAATSTEQAEIDANVTRLHPQIQVEAGEHDAISSIPLADIQPFLNKALVIDDGDLDDAPVIVAGYEERSLLSNSDVAYVRGLPTDKGLTWQIYRQGKALVDPVSNDTLGYEAVFLGNARVEKFGTISTVRIYGAKEEIYPGDHLILAANGFPDNFVPRAPDSEISARVMSIVHGITMAGQKAVVVINKGRSDGIQNGYVLALYRKGKKVPGPHFWSFSQQLPNRRYGLLFVFRTFKNLSYGLVMQTKLPVEMMDIAQTP